jgi:hypothetical protein
MNNGFGLVRRDTPASQTILVMKIPCIEKKEEGFLK